MACLKVTVTRNVSISQNWIVRRPSKGQIHVTFNLNMRHESHFLFLLFLLSQAAKCQRPPRESVWLLELYSPNPYALLAFFIYLFRLGCLDPIKRLIVGIREDCIVVKVQSARLIAAAAASVYEKPAVLRFSRRKASSRSLYDVVGRAR